MAGGPVKFPPATHLAPSIRPAVQGRGPGMDLARGAAAGYGAGESSG